jgi:mandelate racemase
MNHPPLTVRSLRTRAVSVPIKRPLGTSVARMERAPLVLVELETEEGITGRAHVFCYMALAVPMMRLVIKTAGELTTGAALNPGEIARLCQRRFALLGTQGAVGMTLSTLDVGCWDALARATGLPLGVYLRPYLGSAREENMPATVPAYNSNGLSLTDPGEGIPPELLHEPRLPVQALPARLQTGQGAGEPLRRDRSLRNISSRSAVVVQSWRARPSNRGRRC